MYTLNICLAFILVNIQNVAPKVYVIDLTNDSTESAEVNNFKLQELIDIIKKPAKFQEDKLYRGEDPAEGEDCLVSLLTPDKKVKCLKEQKEKSVGRIPFYYHEYYTQRPKRTVLSLYNYYGGLLKSKQPFSDLTRQEFSQDYLDVGDLSRDENGCRSSNCQSFYDNFKRKLRVSHKPQRSERRNIETKWTEDSSSSEESSDSSESDRNALRKVKKNKRERKNKKERDQRKPNRFQVVFNEDSLESEEFKPKRKPVKSFSSESEEKKPETDTSSSSSVEVTIKPLKFKEKYSYLQGNNLYDSFRRRLQHFLPKRFHWDDDDIHHLGYYWFDGPKGKYS